MLLSFQNCERRYTSALEFLNQELPKAGTPWDGIRLDLSNAHLSNEQIALIMQRLQHSHVVELNLSDNHINDEGASIVAVALQTNNQLRRIHLNHNVIKNQGACDLSVILKPELDIDLRHNQIGPDGAEAWTDACAQTNKLSVDLSHNLLGDRGASQVAHRIRQNAGRIQRLVLTHNQIGALGDQELAVHVPRTIQIFHRIKQVPFAEQHPGIALALACLVVPLLILPFLTAEREVEGCDYNPRKTL